MENRQLKFRAWDRFNEHFYYSDKEKNLSEFFAKVQAAIDGGNEVIVDQWVGKYGSAQNDFYDGDIIRFSGTSIVDDTPYTEDYMIMWDPEGLYGLRFTGDNPQWLDGPVAEHLLEDDEYQLVGNRHQNPELCKGM